MDHHEHDHDREKNHIHIHLPECWGDIFREIHADLRTRFARIEKVMSQISEKLAELKSAVLAETQESVDLAAANKAKLAELQALVDAGSASPADLAALDELKGMVAAINPNDPATIETARAAAARAVR